MPLPSNYRDQLILALQQRKAKTTCEVCEQNNWAIVDQAIGLPITDLSGNVIIPSPQIPAACLICNNCGNIRLFALGALGLLPGVGQEAQK
jgi:hypothetical protein